jgi:phosphoribosyl-AMP cyclohydrolase
LTGDREERNRPSVLGLWFIQEVNLNTLERLKVETLKFNANGLIPAIIQDHQKKDVLMLAWMNAESLRRTIESGEAWFWSRSRQELWHKGATSGNTQKVVDIRIDCDADTLLVLVEPSGPACHTGQRSCFFSRLQVEK